jgi:hypothetical protein
MAPRSLAEHAFGGAAADRAGEALVAGGSQRDQVSSGFGRGGEDAVERALRSLEDSPPAIIGAASRGADCRRAALSVPRASSRRIFRR